MGLQTRYCRQRELGGAPDKATAGNGNWVGLRTRLLQAMGTGWGSRQGYCRQRELGGAPDKAISSYTCNQQPPKHISLKTPCSPLVYDTTTSREVLDMNQLNVCMDSSAN